MDPNDMQTYFNKNYPYCSRVIGIKRILCKKYYYYDCDIYGIPLRWINSNNEICQGYIRPSNGKVLSKPKCQICEPINVERADVASGYLKGETLEGFRFRPIENQ